MAGSSLPLPSFQPGLVLSRRSDAEWVPGRAEMLYRNLLPAHLGGRYVASHIRIPQGGPVPDYVHFHTVRFQVICCVRGWVRVVYEDQGPPFIMEPGDCVLQPPRIRHRVLECSDGLEVLEVTCPADHQTSADPDTQLPTAHLDETRRFEGQQFCRHAAAGGRWSKQPGVQVQDSGILAASGGLVAVRTLRPDGEGSPTPRRATNELCLHFVTAGQVHLTVGARPPAELGVGDALVVPPGGTYAFAQAASETRLLQITAPG